MSITFYATIDHRQVKPCMTATHVMLPASAWAAVKFRPPTLPEDVIAVSDSGAYRALQIGGYSFTIEQYVNWLNTFRPRWAATRDYVCAFADEQTVIERQQFTSDQAWQMWRVYPDVPWKWTPVIQGWTVEEYRCHARELRPLIQDMRRKGHSEVVGIGTLKVRDGGAEVSRIVHAVADALPGIPFHLFGVSLKFIKARDGYFPQTASIDTSLWDGRCGHKARHAANAEQMRLGLSRMEHGYNVALPRYLQKVETALSSPKQLSLL